MSELAELLELIHSAHERYRSLRATVREWQDQRLARRVFNRQSWDWRGLTLTSELESRSHGSLLENRVRLGAVGRARRFERESGWLGSWGAYHSWGGLEHLIRPRRLFAGLQIEIEGHSERAGRAAVELCGVRRRWREESLLLLHLGDDYALSVDAERGTLLRIAARLDGQEFQGQEVLAVEFDGVGSEDLLASAPWPTG